MAAVDALFRVVVRRASALLDGKLAAGERIDVEDAAEQAIEELASVITMDGYVDELRARLVLALSRPPDSR
jgi:hypothetical protein